MLLALTENTQNVLRELRRDRDALKREVSSLRHTLLEASEGGIRSSTQMEGLTLHCRDLEDENRQLVEQLQSSAGGRGRRAVEGENGGSGEGGVDAGLLGKITDEWQRLSQDWQSQEVIVEELARHKEQLTAQVGAIPQSAIAPLARI